MVLDSIERVLLDYLSLYSLQWLKNKFYIVVAFEQHKFHSLWSSSNPDDHSKYTNHWNSAHVPFHVHVLAVVVALELVPPIAVAAVVVVVLVQKPKMYHFYP